MAEVVDQFRAKISEKLKMALGKRSKEEVSTLRSIMAAIDNAGALSHDEISRLPDAWASEVPRKSLTKEDILDILQKEIHTRDSAMKEYERIGNQSQVELVRQSISVIQELSRLLS